MRRVLSFAGVAVVAAVIAGLGRAQSPELAGTWTLDAARSRVDAEAGLNGLIAAGVPERLHVTQPANGTLVIESEINESHARIYRPGGTTATPVFVGQAGSIVMTSRWEGGKLVSEGTRELTSDTSSASTDVEEVIGLGADGRTLEIQIVASGPDGQSESRLAYVRTASVGTCESWPSPCKYPSN